MHELLYGRSVEFNDRGQGKEEREMSGKVNKFLAKGTVSILNIVLRTEANSASCILMHQPKAPKELERYRKTK